MRYSRRGTRIAIAVAGTVVTAGLLYVVLVDSSAPAILVLTAGLLAVGFVAGAQVALLLIARPRWRGAAARGFSGWNELRRELDRSRRSGHALGLIRLARPPTGRWDARAVAESTADAARDLLRSSDAVWIDGGALYAMLPESTAEGAGRAVRRIIPHLPLEDVRITTTAFPEDGWTSEVLLAKLHGYQVSGIAYEEMDELKQRQRRQQVRRSKDARATSKHDRVDREAS